MLTAHGPKLEKVWPDVAPRLAQMLRRRGVSHEDVEDVVQETAMRALQHEVEFVDAEDLLRWTNTVAWRIVLNRRRGDARRDLGPVPEVSATEGVAERALARYTLDKVAARFGALSDADRAALTVTDDATSRTRAESLRLYVQRHRARARLTNMLEGLLGALGWLILGRRRKVKGRTVAIATAVPIVALLMVTLPRTLPGPQDTPRLRSTPSIALPESAVPSAATHPSGRRTAPTSPTVVAAPRDGVIKIPPFKIPLHPDLDVGVEEKTPEHKLTCLDPIVVPEICVEEPAVVKELFGGEPAP